MKISYMPSIYLSCIAFITLLFSGLASSKNSTINPQFIEQDDYIAFSEKSDTVVIDVRTPREFTAGYIPGAINIPHRDIINGSANLQAYKDKNIVFYCHTGVRVNIVKRYLEKTPALQPEKIYHLRGDYRAWQARGRTIIKPQTP